MANYTGKKYGGRKKGTPNKLTSELRSVLKNLIHTELNDLTETIKDLEPKDRLELIIKLMPYALPKVNSVSSSSNEPIQIEPVEFIL